MIGFQATNTLKAEDFLQYPYKANPGGEITRGRSNNFMQAIKQICSLSSRVFIVSNFN
jgi:hypothetical protein